MSLISWFILPFTNRGNSDTIWHTEMKSSLFHAQVAQFFYWRYTLSSLYLVVKDWFIKHCWNATIAKKIEEY